MSLPKIKNYINGEWVDSGSQTVGDVWNPATGEEIATVGYGTSENVDQAVKAAQAAAAQAQLALAELPITEKIERWSGQLTVPYSFYEQCKRLIENHHGQIDAEDKGSA